MSIGAGREDNVRQYEDALSETRREICASSNCLPLFCSIRIVRMYLLNVSVVTLLQAPQLLTLMLESENTMAIICDESCLCTSKDISRRSACSLSGLQTDSHITPMLPSSAEIA